MLKKLIKFCVTGGLGTVTNLVLFFIFADKLHLNPTAVSIGCFIIACTQNYIINHLWTFKVENDGAPLSLFLWAKFVVSSLCGLAVNLIVLNILLHTSVRWPYYVIPQGIGILAGMGINFVFSNFFVFRGKKS